MEIMDRCFTFDKYFRLSTEIACSRNGRLLTNIVNFVIAILRSVDRRGIKESNVPSEMILFTSEYGMSAASL